MPSPTSPYHPPLYPPARSPFPTAAPPPPLLRQQLGRRTSLPTATLQQQSAPAATDNFISADSGTTVSASYNNYPASTTSSNYPVSSAASNYPAATASSNYPAATTSSSYSAAPAANNYPAATTSSNYPTATTINNYLAATTTSNNYPAATTASCSDSGSTPSVGGLKGGGNYLARNRWGHYQFGLKGGADADNSDSSDSNNSSNNTSSLGTGITVTNTIIFSNTSAADTRNTNITTTTTASDSNAVSALTTSTTTSSSDQPSSSMREASDSNCDVPAATSPASTTQYTTMASINARGSMSMGDMSAGTMSTMAMSTGDGCTEEMSIDGAVSTMSLSTGDSLTVGMTTGCMPSGILSTGGGASLVSTVSLTSCVAGVTATTGGLVMATRPYHPHTGITGTGGGGGGYSPSHSNSAVAGIEQTGYPVSSSGYSVASSSGYPVASAGYSAVSSVYPAASSSYPVGGRAVAPIPAPPKHSIPPSSRHQAVIGIPGGGAIPTYTSHFLLESPATTPHHYQQPPTATLTTTALAQRPVPSLPQHLQQQQMMQVHQQGQAQQLLPQGQSVPQHQIQQHQQLIQHQGQQLVQHPGHMLQQQVDSQQHVTQQQQVYQQHVVVGSDQQHLHQQQQGVRMMMKNGVAGVGVRMMMIRHPSQSPLLASNGSNGVTTPVVVSSGPSSPMPPPPSSPQLHVMPPPASRSPQLHQSPSHVSPAQSPVACSAADAVGTPGGGQNALLKQLLQNNSNQQFVVVRSSLNHGGQQATSAPPGVLHHHQRAAGAAPPLQHQLLHQQAPAGSILVQQHLQQQVRPPLQQQPQQPHRVVNPQAATSSQVVVGAGGNLLQGGQQLLQHPYSSTSSLLVGPHPALRQLPPSPTPHLVELVEEEQRNNAKKRAAAAAAAVAGGVLVSAAGGSTASGTGVVSAAAAVAAAAQPRRRSQSKEGPSKTGATGPATRRPRPEEDYDAYLDSMMTQLRAMPALSVMEPSVYPNFNVCPVYGSGELAKLGRPEHDHRRGKLHGKSAGSLVVKDWFDYYDTKPLGPSLPIVPPLKTPPTARGFYSMEFPPPKIGFPMDELSDEVAAITNVSSNSTGAAAVGGAVAGVTAAGCITPTRPASAASSLADSPDTVLTSSSPECVMPDSPPHFRGLKLIDMEEDIPDRCSSPMIPLLIPVPTKRGELPRLSTGRCHNYNSLEDNKVKQEPKSELKETFPITSDALKSSPIHDIKQEKDLPDDVKTIKEEKENYHNYENFASIILKNRIGENPALPLKHDGNVTVEMTLPSNACEDIAGVLRSLANVLNIPPPKIYDIKHEGAPPKVSKKWKLCDKQEVHVESILNGQTRFCKLCSNVADKTPITKRVSEMPYINREQVLGTDEITFCSRQCFVQYTMAHRIDLPQLPVLVKQEEELEDDSDSNDDNDSNSERGTKRKLDNDEEEEFPVQPDGKRFRGHKYRLFNGDTFMPEKKEKPTDREMTELLFRMQITYRKRGLPQDSRRCSLCQLYGDCVADGPSRLLNYDLDKWVHLNCALWADDVYETMSGSLVNVETGMKKALTLTCEHCENPGASVKCFKVRCSKVFHLNCAVKEGCTFYKNKTVYCHEHSTKGDKESELSTLAAWRRVYVERDENRQVASVMHHTELNHLLRIGSLVLLNIGQLLPNQLQAFHTPYCIYPVGFKVIRLYWSMRSLHKRCAYQCSIHEVEGQPEFEIVVVEDCHDDLTLVSRSPKGVWNKVLTPIMEMRQAADLVKLFPQYISGEDLFGLTGEFNLLILIFFLRILTEILLNNGSKSILLYNLNDSIVFSFI